jgi:hypothetical protein
MFYFPCSPVHKICLLFTELNNEDKHIFRESTFCSYFLFFLVLRHIALLVASLSLVRISQGLLHIECRVVSLAYHLQEPTWCSNAQPHPQNLLSLVNLFNRHWAIINAPLSFWNTHVDMFHDSIYNVYNINLQSELPCGQPIWPLENIHIPCLLGSLNEIPEVHLMLALSTFVWNNFNFFCSKLHFLYNCTTHIMKPRYIS